VCGAVTAVEHFAGGLKPRRIKCRAPANRLAAAFLGCERFTCALADELALEVGERGENVEYKAPCR
jgi:hypothetical protein